MSVVIGIDDAHTIDGVGLDDLVRKSLTGFGTNVPPAMATSVDNYKSTGVFRDPGSLTNSPFSTNAATIMVFAFDGTDQYVTQMAFKKETGTGTTSVKYRSLRGANGWSAWIDFNNAGDLLTLIKTVDGIGSGLDADLLDGLHASSFATAAQGATADAALPASSYTASDALTKIKTVDGPGSGLDADFLDGQHASAFATAAQGATADAALPAASYTAADVLTKVKTLDGAGSGLDADLLDGKDSTEFFGTTVSTNEQTGTSYTLVLGDRGKTIFMNNAAANTLTIPTNASVAFPVGTQIDIVQTGAGKTTVAGAGVTINSVSSNKSISARYAGATLIKTATDTWLLIGSLIA